MTHRATLVCFDLGRVLVRLADSRSHAAQRAGIRMPELSEYSIAQWERLRDEHEMGRLTFDQFSTQVSAVSGVTPADHIALYESWLCGGFDGVADLIDRVNARAATACLSNTNDLHWRMMSEGDGPNRLPLERLTWRFASHLIGAMKPDAAIYEHVERQTGFAGGQIVFFDDHPPNVEAAARRGWRACRIEPAHDPVEQMTRHLQALNVL